MHIARDVPLADHTTFALGGPARFFAAVHDDGELQAALAFAREGAIPLFVLGGGSNLVVSDRGFDGLVVHMRTTGITRRDDGPRARWTVAAGEPWDAFVERTVAQGFSGLECLSGIPGSVGATPIQNVGAYGQEVAQTIVAVRTLHRVTGELVERAPEDCAFRYRHSIFKDSATDEIVTRVTFALERAAPRVRYGELERALAGTTPDVALVRAKVLELRRGKSMVLDAHDENRRSAGSFFTNPIVAPAVADEVVRRALDLGIATDAREVPRFPEGDRVKLSAAWLIERSGMSKGTRRGAFGISSRHSLALVHHGGGSAEGLLVLAREIASAVRERFDVHLTPEPVLLGFDGAPLG